MVENTHLPNAQGSLTSLIVITTNFCECIMIFQDFLEEIICSFWNNVDLAINRNIPLEVVHITFHVNPEDMVN
jgi:hypothetical protein